MPDENKTFGGSLFLDLMTSRAYALYGIYAFCKSDLKESRDFKCMIFSGQVFYNIKEAIEKVLHNFLTHAKW